MTVWYVGYWHPAMFGYDSGHGGSYFKAASAKAALQKAHKIAQGWMSFLPAADRIKYKLATVWSEPKRISAKLIEGRQLDNLHRYLPEVEIRHWMPGIKGSTLLRLARKEIGKEQSLRWGIQWDYS